ncbi:MAG: hypothetical protein ACI4C1_01750 [Lachnospiraceae bacterium]
MDYRNYRGIDSRYGILRSTQDVMPMEPTDWMGMPIPVLDRAGNVRSNYSYSREPYRYYQNGMYCPDWMDRNLNRLNNDLDDNQEVEYWLSMYPERMKKIQAYVEEALEEEDYSGSFIYDEYPDKERVYRMAEGIYNKMMKEDEWQETSTNSLFETGMTSQQGSGPMRPPRPPRPPRPNPQPPAPPQNNWLKDAISVLLFHELHRRRCRHRGCRR